MAGTISGGQKASKTTRARHGKDFYARIGRMGGMKSRNGGFSKDRQLASEAGRKGGQKSSRAGIKNRPKEPTKEPFEGSILDN